MHGWAWTACLGDGHYLVRIFAPNFAEAFVYLGKILIFLVESSQLDKIRKWPASFYELVNFQSANSWVFQDIVLYASRSDG